MEKESLEFCFKGTRTYVHGTDIYNKMIEVLASKMKNEKLDLSFHGVAEKNMNLVASKPEDESTLKFVCKYLDNNNIKNILYGVENNKDIECRYEYPEEDICNLSRLNLKDEEVVLESNSSFSFVENTVAINKYLLENLFPNVQGKWYFTRFQIKDVPCSDIYPLKLILKANFNFKLTKTEILINDKSIGFIYFSLV
jgi:hypothetical protein